MLSIKYPNDTLTINIIGDGCRIAIHNDDDEVFMWLNHGELAKLIFDLQEAKEEIELHSMARDFQGPATAPKPEHRLETEGREFSRHARPPEPEPIHTGSLESTIIENFDWDPVSKELVIVFKSGQSYTYFDVSQEVVEGFIDAGSYGSYYNVSIKGKYRSEKN